MTGGELRRDPVVDRWVIFAADRARRPNAFPALRPEPAPEACPFCPGMESATPPEVLARAPEGREADRPGWRVRVVPNLYPALDEGADTLPSGGAAGVREAGWGVHEVVVETPAHDERLRTLGTDRLTEVLAVWGERMRALETRERVRQVMVYRNEGPEAGATLAHPHAQILALPRISRDMEDELRGARTWWDREGSCFYCDLLAGEVSGGARLIHADESVVMLAPFASRVPYETWILPRRHEAGFGEASAGVLKGAAEGLTRWAECLEGVLGSFGSNLVLHTAPADPEACPHYHWHLELLPRITRMAGFEWGSGWTINPVFPERAAAVLRGDADA